MAMMITAVILWLCVAPATAPTSRGNAAVVVGGDLAVDRGQEVRITVMLQCESSSNGTLFAHNAFLDPNHYVPASVVILSDDRRKLADLVVSKNPKSVAEPPVPIRRSRAAGRIFRVPTGGAKEAEFTLPPGDYFVQATYFESIFSGSTDSSKVLCKTKLHPIKVR